jgi:two-component system NarL family response regulator
MSGAKENPPTIKLLIVDDQVLVRAGLQNLLSDQEDIELVGEAENGYQALAMAEELRPDVLLVDVKLPDFSGIEVVQRIKRSSQGKEIEALMLTVYDDLDVATEAIKAGAIGYILKDCDKEELISAIRKASLGEPHLSPEIAKKILNLLKSRDEEELSSVLRGDTRGWTGEEEVQTVTPREKEVLRLIAKGFGNKAIARELFITESTVKVHTKNIYRKLGVEDRASAILAAIKRGWI